MAAAAAAERVRLRARASAVLAGLGEKLFTLVQVPNGLRQASPGGVQSRWRKALERRGIAWRSGLRCHVGRHEDDGRVKFQQPKTQEARQDRRLNKNPLRQAFPAIRNRRQEGRSGALSRPGGDAK
jgi:hypothetical protein